MDGGLCAFGQPERVGAAGLGGRERPEARVGRGLGGVQGAADLFDVDGGGV